MTSIIIEPYYRTSTALYVTVMVTVIIRYYFAADMVRTERHKG